MREKRSGNGLVAIGFTRKRKKMNGILGGGLAGFGWNADDLPENNKQLKNIKNL